jgi:hypothetical protein
MIDATGEAPPRVRHRIALTILCLLALLAFAKPLLFGEVPIFRDHRDYFQPLRFHTAAELRAGHLPLWNPYSASGEPWLANPQTAVFYPPAWMFLVLPFSTAYVLYLALHLAILGCGTYRMLATRVSREAAMAGAVALMFSGPVFSLVDISNNLTTFAWLPWVIWSALDGSSSRRAGVILALAFLGGEPFYAGVAALLYALIVRTPRRIAASAMYAFGLSAVQLLPFLEMLRGSDRAAGLPADQLFRDSANLRDWLRMAVPPSLTVDVVDPSLSQHFIAVIYVGMATIILAAVGVMWGRKKEVALWLLLLVAAILVSAGNTQRPVAYLLEHFPVTLFRYPARMIPIGAIAIAALAAIGWDRVRPRRRRFDFVVIALLLVEVAPFSMRLLASVPFQPADPYARDVAASSKLLRVGNRVGADRYAWIAGYLNLYSRRFDSWSAAPVMSDRYGRWFLEAFGGTRLDLVDRLPAGWILAQQDLGPRFEPVSALRGVKLFRNPHALPMATLWASVRGAVDADAALAGALDARNVGDLYVSPAPSLKPVNRRAIVPARLTRIDSSSATVVTDSSFSGVLVLTQRDAPGWSVSVDGVPSRKLLADGNFRAVQLEAGHHVVTWRYLPLSLILGAAMTCVTLAFTQVRAFVKRRSSPKFS